MHRTTFVLLLLIVTLPMAAEEVTTVTVHQAEWGDTRGEAPPPSGPLVPARAPEPVLVFQKKGFRYGENVRYYRRTNQYGAALRYRPETHMRGRFPQITGSQFRMNGRYGLGGLWMRNGYKPNIQYAAGIERLTRGDYGLSR